MFVVSQHTVNKVTHVPLVVHSLHGCLDVWFLLMGIQVYKQNTALWYADQVHKVGGFNVVAVKCPG